MCARSTGKVAPEQTARRILAVVVTNSLTTAALAQQPAPTTAGPAAILTRMVTNFYQLSVYDPSDNKIGDVDDVLIARKVVSPP